MFKPRPKQEEVLSYRRGKMGVAAVPGSGKTHTLSYLAANIILREELEEDQEVLIVTLVNSAVDNFAGRISGFLHENEIFAYPGFGYCVRTLHGLSHDIVRERPSLVGLADNFQIIDEQTANQIRSEAARAWLHANIGVLDEYLRSDLDERQRELVRRKDLLELVTGIANSVIRSAKDQQINPEKLRLQLDGLPLPLRLAEMSCEIYSDYQRGLNYRGAVDFDDLTRLALQALNSDEEYLQRLRHRWHYILEDEAQDSSRLQEEILELLVGENGNWVRVGDPNQAIYETFTTANPEYLRSFLKRDDVYARELPNSGRSTLSIISLANQLIRWTQHEHPNENVRNALAPPEIAPTPHGDPQPNPEDNPAAIRFIPNKFTSQEEVRAVVDSVARWLPKHNQETVAMLVPRNQRGFEVAKELGRRKIDYVENLQSSSTTRATAGALGNIVNYLAEPQSAKKLATVYRVWQRENIEQKGHTSRIAALISSCNHVESFIWPKVNRDWLDEVETQPEEGEFLEKLQDFRQVVQRWQGLVLLPIDQVILTLAQDLFEDLTQLAIAHKIALVLRRASDLNPDWRLPQLAGELALVAKNERRFIGFSEDDRSFDPENYRGRVYVTTIHKAKGLEWDRVYLMSINNYDFPSAIQGDKYISEKWFLRDALNLEAEALAQLRAAFSNDEYSWYQKGEATHSARLDYAAERLRLLFVGITRAKKELILTWNTGRNGECREAQPFTALKYFWEEFIHDHTS
ncbi:MAG: ATP-dependent helicase [Anaerolineales bacterium]